MPDRIRPAARALEWFAVVAGTAAKVWLVSAHTISGFGWATFDDLWFLNKAASILDGAWFGDYNQRTLIKGPAYPLWIALVSGLGLPLALAQQLLHALAALAVVRSVAPLVRHPAARAAFFLVLLFNPMTYASDIANRTTREGFYPAVALLVFAGTAGALLRLDARRAVLLAWAVLSGAAIAVFWHTREEGVWVLPFLLCALAGLLRWTAIDWRARWRRASLAAGVPAILAVAAHLAIVVTNGLLYDVWAVADFKERSFVRAYSSLTHVRQYPSRRRIPVPKETRERIYAVSPAFAELRPFLEGDVGATWIHNGISQVRENEIGGAWFMWAFRDSVSLAGYYNLGARAVAEYYDRLSREIESARRSGRLDARPPRASLLPPILKGQRRAVLRVWRQAVARVLTFADAAVYPVPSAGTDERLRPYYEIARSRMSPRPGRGAGGRRRGAGGGPRGPLQVAAHSGHRGLIDRPENRSLPPRGDGASRFEIRALAGHAHLVLSSGGWVVERIPLDQQPPATRIPGIRLEVEQFRIEIEARRQSRSEKARFAIMNAVGRAYGRAFPVAFAVALVFCLAGIGRILRRGGDWTAALLLCGVLAAIAARTLILSLIEVLSFDVLIGGYQSPSHALQLAAFGLAAALGWDAFRSRRAAP